MIWSRTLHLSAQNGLEFERLLVVVVREVSLVLPSYGRYILLDDRTSI